jgi:hypothetical protein
MGRALAALERIRRALCGEKMHRQHFVFVDAPSLLRNLPQASAGRIVQVLHNAHTTLGLPFPPRAEHRRHCEQTLRWGLRVRENLAFSV